MKLHELRSRAGSRLPSGEEEEEEEELDVRLEQLDNVPRQLFPRRLRGAACP